MYNFRQKLILGTAVISIIVCVIAMKLDLGVDTNAETYVEYTSENQKSHNNRNIENDNKDIKYTAVTTTKTNDSVADTYVQTTTKNGLLKVNRVWGYYVNNQLQTEFSGFQSNENGTYVVENGIVTLQLNGLIKVENDWYVIKNSKLQENAYGVYKNKNGYFLVQNGKVNFNLTGLKRVKGEWYYFKKGKLQTEFTGIKDNVNGTWLVEDGEIDFQYKGTYVEKGSISNPKKGQKRYYVKKNKIDKKRSKIVTQALAYLNTPYVYGGTNLKSGIDCSAFTRAIYSKAGISLERTARSQATQGKNISLKNAKPGDLIFYSNGRFSSISHVAIYIGNNKIVHAGYSKRKVVVANVDLGMNIKCIKSFVK